MGDAADDALEMEISGFLERGDPNIPEWERDDDDFFVSDMDSAREFDALTSSRRGRKRAERKKRQNKTKK